MDYKKYFLTSTIIILSIIIVKNIITLSEFHFIANESTSYNIGRLFGSFIKIIGFIGLIKMSYNKLKLKSEFLTI